MNTRTACLIALLFTVVSLLTTGARAEEGKAPPALADTLDQWISLLETDSAKAPVKFASDEKAAKAMQEHWEALKKAHEKHDYRKWLESAKKVKDDKFVVGGHDHSHTHVEWVKTDAGWKLGAIWFCR